MGEERLGCFVAEANVRTELIATHCTGAGSMVCGKSSTAHIFTSFLPMPGLGLALSAAHCTLPLWRYAAAQGLLPIPCVLQSPPWTALS